jgi:DNA replication protein DnaC
MSKEVVIMDGSFLAGIPAHAGRIPAALELCTPEVGEAVALLRRWSLERRERPGLSLLLCGPPGVGKTHLARAALWSEVYTVDDVVVGPVGRFYLAYDLLLRLTPEGGQTLTAAVQQAVGNAPLVVLDDAGQDVQLPYVAAEWQAAERQVRLHALVDYCYVQRVSLVVTTNLRPGQALQDWLGPRSWDRLVEMAPRPYIFQFRSTPSYRKARSGYVVSE